MASSSSTTVADHLPDRPYRLVVPWQLVWELSHVFWFPVLFAILGGGLIASLLVLADFTYLGFPEMSVACGYWIAACMTFYFRGHLGRMFFWVIILDSGIIVYQMALYMAVRENPSPFLELGPLVITSIVFISHCGSSSPAKLSMLYLWVLANLPAFILGNLHGLVTEEEVIVFFYFNVFYPLIYYYGVHSLFRDGHPPKLLFDALTLAILIMVIINLILIPVELLLRGTTGLHTLQFGGRAYYLIGNILLVWPILITNIRQWKPYMRFLIYFLILSTFIASVSRGAFITLGLLLGASLFAGKHYRSELFVNMFMMLLTITLGIAVLDIDWLNFLVEFWLKRFDLFDNASMSFSWSSESSYFQSDRMDLWKLALKIYEESPIWGFGIGSNPALVGRETNNELLFSSMHSIFLTTMVERGIVGLFGLLALFGLLIKLILAQKHLPINNIFFFLLMSIYLLFANTTGAELFMNGGARGYNATAVTHIFIILGLLEYSIAALPERVTIKPVCHATLTRPPA